MSVSAPISGDLGVLVVEYRDHLTAAGKSPHTVRGYGGHAYRFAEFLVREDLPTDAVDITRRHVRAYIRSITLPAASVAAFNALRSFFAFLVENEEIKADANPMIGIPRPKESPMSPVPVLPADAAERMIAVCRTHRGFWPVRNEALIRLFWDTPGRLSEIAGIQLDDVNIAERQILVLGKGGKWRTMRFRKETGKALHRYIAARAALYKPEWGDALWIGKGGGKHQSHALTSGGIYDVIRRIAKQAGLGDVHPHQFRHTFADRWLEAGGGEVDLIHLAGWSGPRMLMRYGRANAQNRALGAYDRVLG